MANKIYRMALVVKEEERKFLEKCCKTYRKVFNYSMKIQDDIRSHGLTYEEQLMSLSSLESTIFQEIEGSEYFSRIDKGIIQRAIEAAYFNFHKAWNLRTYSNKKGELFHRMKKSSTFRTSTPLKVSKGGYVYFPKFGRIKLVKSNFIPIGTYKNAQIIRENNRWQISLEALEKSQEEHTLHGTLDIHITKDGDILFRDKIFTNVIGNKGYQEANKKRKYYLKVLRDKAKVNSYRNHGANAELSKNMKDIEGLIEKYTVKMKNIKMEYFKVIVKEVLKEEPEVIVFTYDSDIEEIQEFSSDFFRESGTLTLIKMIRSRLSGIGTLIRYSYNISEKIYSKLNF